MDHTADSGKREEVFVPDTAFSSVSPSTNLPSSVSSSDSEDENEDDETQRKRKLEWSTHWLITQSIY